LTLLPKKKKLAIVRFLELAVTTASPLLPLRHTRKGARTRERILDAAERVFAEKGFAGTSLRDVADAAGLRIPSLYNHFPGKESLYAAVLERGLSPVLALLSEWVRAGAAGDRRVYLERLLALIAQRPNVPRLVQHETLAGAERLPPLLREWFKPAFAKAEEILRASRGARRWSDEEIPLLVIAAFTFPPVYRALTREDLSHDVVARQARFFGDLVAALLPEE
jgi:AcrR family transcriptional regulator